MNKNMKIKILMVIIACFVVGATSAIILQQTMQPKNQVLIGGKFKLTDHNGKRVTEKDFQGKLTLMYFGYTHCPDICPGDIQVMASALDQLGPKSKDINAIFVSIDPERDTVETIRKYLGHFHKDIIGLTGTEEEIREIAKAYRIFHSRVEAPDSGIGYLMNHSTITYLMDKNGKYLTHFNHATPPKQMVERISKHL